MLKPEFEKAFNEFMDGGPQSRWAVLVRMLAKEAFLAGWLASDGGSPEKDNNEYDLEPSEAPLILR